MLYIKNWFNKIDKKVFGVYVIILLLYIPLLFDAKFNIGGTLLGHIILFIRAKELLNWKLDITILISIMFDLLIMWNL
jgi:hypothetical protein